MSGSFATSEQHSHFNLRPLMVAALKHEVYREAKSMVADLPAWKLVSADDEHLVLTCERSGGLFAGPAIVTIRIDGPDGIPSATVNVASQSTGGFTGLSRDRANVLEFMKPFHRRVC
jgi:hypothetical protein